MQNGFLLRYSIKLVVIFYNTTTTTIYGPLFGTTRVSRYQKNIHPSTILIIIQSL